jgi:hypothetical protein
MGLSIISRQVYVMPMKIDSRGYGWRGREEARTEEVKGKRVRRRGQTNWYSKCFHRLSCPICMRRDQKKTRVAEFDIERGQSPYAW